MQIEDRLKKNSVGIIGYWYATNYGSVVTYYALYKTIEELGYDAVLIDRPEVWNDPEGMDTISRLFLNSHCVVSDSCKWEDIRKLNDICETFVIGSDQVWTKDAMRIMKNMFFLNFADKTKRKIAYAPSFGYDNIDITGKELNDVSKYLHEFHAISVREDSGKKILSDKFMIDAEQNVDPVFLLDSSIYDEIASESDYSVTESYILAYLLDPTEDKERALKQIELTLGKRVYIVLDARYGTFDENLSKLKIYGIDDVAEDVKVEDWILLFKEASYIFTDSHHGLAMGIIFRKQMICYANARRGYTRFTSLLNMLEMSGRMIQNSTECSEPLIKEIIDYTKVHCTLNARKEKSRKWLLDALGADVGKKSYRRTDAPDFERCRMVVSMLKQYGIKHVVLSSGTRNLTLCRFFEHNKYFTTYMVIDERSAAFYALGLAVELKEPVAICCTSGTAASNYLSAVTEAYYQGVPLVVITADRYPCFQNNMEDQTIPQTSIFIDVCKKIVNLPVNTDSLAAWETRRLISEALLELDHHGKGPVHINVPLNTIQRKPPAENLFWLWNYRYISRVDMKSSKQVWEEKYKELRSKRRILIIYGQNRPLDEQEKEILHEFLDKFNCVLLRDHLSNLSNDEGLLSFPVLNRMSQKEFNEEYAPDMVISMYGKRMLNDPVTFRLRGTGDFTHWRISEDGMPKDPYRKLSVIFEYDGIDFMKRMLELSETEEKNDRSYYELWKQRYIRQSVSDEYTMKNIVGWCVSKIPEGALVHIAIGNTVMFANCFEMNKDVEVYCNMGTNGIDGCASTFMGSASISERLSYLIIGDCSFFYDMNSLFNKNLKNNIRIILINNNGAGLLRDHESPSVTQEHGYYSAKAYAESLGFRYCRAGNKEELSVHEADVFTGGNEPIFLEVFCE